MPTNRIEIIRAAQRVFQEQNREVEAVRDRQMQAVVSQTGTGSGDIDSTFGLDRKYRVVFVRCHFTGTAGTNQFALSVDSAAGSAYDTELFTISQAGKDKDVHLRVSGEDLANPSPWTFGSGDRIRIQWTNPDSGNITWGLEVGLTLAL